MKINFFAQDPAVLPAIPLNIPNDGIKKGPSDSRIVVRDRVDYPEAAPDKNGNCLYKPEQPQFDACEVFGVLKTGMDLYSKILQRELPFAFPGKVQLLPHDGEGINAFYSRDDQAVHFLEMSSPKFKKDPRLHEKTLRMAQSLDVGAHEEVGHLLLDGIKPGYLNLELESQAFHEAFGDISSMILALQFDQVLDKLLKETQGNLRNSNLVSRLGEEAAMALQDLSALPKKNHDYLRDSTMTMQNNWKYKAPENLGAWVPSDERKLGAEPHNFSRFFSGLWYEILVNLYEKNLERGEEAKEALKNARDTAARLLLRAVSDFSPDTSARYDLIAQGMLEADENDYGGKNQNLLLKIFREREIPLEKKFPLQSAKINLKSGTSIQTKRDAMAFLAKHRKSLGLDKRNLPVPAPDFPEGHPRFICRNEKGETFLSFEASEQNTLAGSLYQQLHGAEYTSKGSLKLGFDRQGNLIHFSSDLITPEKHGKIQKSIHHCLKNELITMVEPEKLKEGPRHFFKEEKERKIPYFAYSSWKDGKLFVERVPVWA